MLLRQLDAYFEHPRDSPREWSFVEPIRRFDKDNHGDIAIVAAATNISVTKYPRFLHTLAMLFVPHPRGNRVGDQENRGEHHSRASEHQCDRGGTSGDNRGEVAEVGGKRVGGESAGNEVFVLIEGEDE